MTQLDALRSAVEALRANPMRSLLTMLGIIIGVAAVIAVVAVGAGARRLVIDQIKSLGTNLIVIKPGSLTSGGLHLSNGSRLSLSQGDALSIARELPQVQHAVPMVRGTVQVVAGDLNWSTVLYGATPDFMGARDWDLQSGRAFTPEENDGAAKVVLLGDTVARTLFGDADPVGSLVRVQKVPMQVIGVLAAKGQTKQGQDQDDTVIVPLSTAKKRILGENPANAQAVDTIVVRVFDGEDMSNAEQQIRDLLRQRHGLLASQEDDFLIKNLSEVLAIREASYRTLALLLAAIAAVSLVVGGIGIMNIMLVSVIERTREIGIRVAVGARRRDILIQFLIESVALACAGGGAGLLTGFVTAAGIASMAGWPTVIKPEMAALAVGCSSLVGVAFGFYPARRAAYLDPIEALRHV